MSVIQGLLIIFCFPFRIWTPTGIPGGYLHIISHGRELIYQVWRYNDGTNNFDVVKWYLIKEFMTKLEYFDRGRVSTT